MPNFQKPDSKVINDMTNTPFMTFKSRGLIKAALAAGNATGEARRSKIEEFAKKLAEYSWPHTRDYTLACIMLMVVYVASLMNYDYDLVEAKQRNDKGEKQSQDQSIKLSDYITQKINRNKIKDLFNSIINIEKTNDSQSIANNITHNNNNKGWFKKIFTKLISLYENDESKQQEIFRKFVRQVKCMKPWWRYNKKYMQSLTDAIESVLRVNLNIEHQPSPEPQLDPKTEVIDAEEKMKRHFEEFQKKHSTAIPAGKGKAKSKEPYDAKLMRDHINEALRLNDQKVQFSEKFFSEYNLPKWRTENDGVHNFVDEDTLKVIFDRCPLLSTLEFTYQEFGEKKDPKTKKVEKVKKHSHFTIMCLENQNTMKETN